MAVLFNNKKIVIKKFNGEIFINLSSLLLIINIILVQKIICTHLIKKEVCLV